jgi:hypothetical protein
VPVLLTLMDGRPTHDALQDGPVKSVFGGGEPTTSR